MAASGENTGGLHRNPRNHWCLPASNQRRPIVPLEFIHATATATQQEMPAKLSEPVDWVDRYGHAFLRFASGRVASRELAEDFVHETFLPAFRLSWFNVKWNSRFLALAGKRGWWLV